MGIKRTREEKGEAKRMRRIKEHLISMIFALFFVIIGLIADIYGYEKAPFFFAFGAIMLAISAIQYVDYRIEQHYRSCLQRGIDEENKERGRNGDKN